eukprot:CAMPEP_0117441574 /NCGR_PEP_ID=MMETSP0759-20121206/3704_1 /TAXON_ID=63605 /ORGANISM="Percolomonas cosmopolitus, Strain WS" /LENGTH=479 /DNA_ID=CAMNT_0005233431 /DNA_START=303 /DNA_END=1739 /DNA_ORIENTATION=-
MCIVSLALNKHPYFHLIFLNNRDEDVDRETSRLQIHWESQQDNSSGSAHDSSQTHHQSMEVHHSDQDPNNDTTHALLLAKDMHYGVHAAPGSWMGLDLLNGNFACVTNVLEPEDPVYHENSLTIMDARRTNTHQHHEDHSTHHGKPPQEHHHNANMPQPKGEQSAAKQHHPMLHITRNTRTSKHENHHQKKDTHHRTHLTPSPSSPITHYLSRGHLVYKALCGEGIEALRESGMQYGAFNLFFGNIWDNGHNTSTNSTMKHSFYICSNRKKRKPSQIQDPLANIHKVSNGVHAFSNSFFDDEEWPKVHYLKKSLTKKLDTLRTENDPDVLLRELIPLMRAQNVVDHLDNDLRSPSNNSCSTRQPHSKILSKRVIPEYMRRQFGSDDEQFQKDFTNLLNNVWIGEHGKGFMTVSQTVVFASHNMAYYYYHVVDHFNKHNKHHTKQTVTSSLHDLSEFKKTIQLYNLRGVRVDELNEDGGW